ncbi:MAG: RdgB/HAM1 family non-canonical purine NTP pyrophosphatase [Ignavibacteria bacterium]|nr:RdgB/HAM1 family non-canonical purine NTP pyrophosphatase [Ignavibacteria bacterium]
MPTGKKIFVSTQNQGKLKEIRSILGTGEFEFISVQTIDGFPDIEETGTSFEENAIIKAEESFKLTGIPSLADDSGLSVDCLDGAPGVYSARYAGENADDEGNLQKVLSEIKNFSPPYKARYVCVLAFYDGERLITTRGECEGELIMEKRGNNGFGYDPIFVPEGFNKTMAELNPEIKNKLSHRFKALEKMKEALLT